jgi:hypothetical protein
MLERKRGNEGNMQRQEMKFNRKEVKENPETRGGRHRRKRIDRHGD